jgi:uncharacterized membrane protein YvlD (DUF360 family)
MAAEGHHMTNRRPPRIAEAVLRLVLPPQDRETVSGDLLEEYRECVYPQRGRFRAGLWFIAQISGFLHRSNQLWAALLGAVIIARTALDWVVPTVDFHSRSTVSTVLAIGILSLAGFSAAWRSRSPWTGAFAGIVSAATAAGIGVAGTIMLLVGLLLRNPDATLAAIRGSGGLPEALTLPVLLIIPGAFLGAIGGVAGWIVREFVGGRPSRL